MNKKTETIKCIFVTKGESFDYRRQNHLESQISILDCDAKIVNNSKEGEPYHYCNRQKILDLIEQAKELDQISFAMKSTSAKGEYDKYIFECGNTKFDILIPIIPKDLIDKNYFNKDQALDDARIKLDKITDYTIKYNRREKLKKIVTAILTAGIVGTATVSLVKVSGVMDIEYKPQTAHDLYTRYYKDIMTEKEFMDYLEEVKKNTKKYNHQNDEKKVNHNSSQENDEQLVQEQEQETKEKANHK